MANNWIKCCLVVLVGISFALDYAKAEESHAVLQGAEYNYKIGKVDVAISAAKELLHTLEDEQLSQSNGSMQDTSSMLQKVKSDLVVFSVKAGDPSESARIIRELLLELQMASPMMPEFSTSPADVFSKSVTLLKKSFEPVLQRLSEGDETKAIVGSLIDNTVPKDYSKRLKVYCACVQDALKTLDGIRTITDGEELKYGDPLRTLAIDSEGTTNPLLSKERLAKIGATLDELATEAQQLPVGDARPALGLYRVALAANSVGRYEQAESFAQKSLAHLNALVEKPSGALDVKLALGFSYMNQSKMTEFNDLKNEILKNYGARERLLVALARFTKATGDGAGALGIYEIAMQARSKNGNSQKPEWFDDYNELLKAKASE
jgi:hypothetical protein